MAGRSRCSLPPSLVDLIAWELFQDRRLAPASLAGEQQLGTDATVVLAMTCVLGKVLLARLGLTPPEWSPPNDCAGPIDRAA